MGWWSTGEARMDEENRALLEGSSRSVSTSMNGGLESSADHVGGEMSTEKLPNPSEKSRSGFQTASSTDEWLCSYIGCGRTFTHRHKLNRHQKYHNKAHRCHEPPCRARGIAFSLEKDLTRHQAQHNGQRFYCHYSSCPRSMSGEEGGFTRKDNLKRHLTNQHRTSQP